MPNNYFATEYELTLIADKIREKGGTVAALTFPQGFIDAIDAIGVQLNTELVDLTKITTGYIISESTGDLTESQWSCCSDYITFDSTKTYSFIGYQWYNISFYNSSKTYISSLYMRDAATSIEGDYAHGTLSSTNIPSGAAYVRISSYPTNVNNTQISLICTSEGSSSSGGYILTNIVPLQTVACTSQINNYCYGTALQNYTDTPKDDKQYLVTFDGTEYLCEGFLFDTSSNSYNYGFGESRLLYNNIANQYMQVPFCVAHYPNDQPGVPFVAVKTSGTHTIQVDEIELVTGVKMGTKSITANGTYSATTDSLDGYRSVTVNVSAQSPNLQAKTNIVPTTASQTITADSGYDGLSSVQVNGDANLVASNIKSGTSIFGVQGSYGGGGSNLQAKSGITPTETSQFIEPDSGYDGLSSVEVLGIPSNYVGSGVTARNSNSMTVNGAAVTAPAGYYTSDATKSVTAMTLPTAATSSATSGYTSKATVSRSTSDQYINIPTGYNGTGAYYKINAVANGSATTPNTTVTANPTISVSSSGLITATASATQSVSPTISAGYVATGTAGTITVTGSKTQQLTTKAATTYTPGTANQTIASGTYLTGTQTISGDANLVGSNILSGKSIFGVSGTVTFQTIYSGSSAPSSGTGANGDIYIRTS